MGAKNGGSAAARKANKNAPGYRGRGVADLVVEQDFGTQMTSFSVDTRIDLRPGRGGNAAGFKDFIAKLESKKYKSDSKVRDEMVAFLDREVKKLGTPLSDQLQAQNMFRVALGAPLLAAADVKQTFGK